VADRVVRLTVEETRDGVEIRADGKRLLELDDLVGLDLADELTIVIERKRRRQDAA
jgi:hypothetical protein